MGGPDGDWRAAGGGVGGGDVQDNGGVREADAPSRHAVDPVRGDTVDSMRGDGDTVDRMRGDAVEPVRAGGVELVRGSGLAVGWATEGCATVGWVTGSEGAGATMGVTGSPGGRNWIGAGSGSLQARAGRCSPPLDVARGATTSRCGWRSIRARAGLGWSSSSELGADAGPSMGRSAVTDPVWPDPRTRVGGSSSNFAGGLTSSAPANLGPSDSSVAKSPTSAVSEISGSAGSARRGRGAGSSTSSAGASPSTDTDFSGSAVRTGSAARTGLTGGSGLSAGCGSTANPGSTGSGSAAGAGALERRGTFLTTGSATSGSSRSARRGRVTATVSQESGRMAQGSNSFAPEGTRSLPAKWFRQPI